MRMLALLVIVVSACGGPKQSSASLELGTGDQRFITLNDGDPVPIIHGLQGGYHVWGSVRVSNMAPMGLHLQFALARVDGSGPPTMRTDVVDLVDGEHLGTAVFVPDPDGVRDQPCALSVSAIDGDGRAATGERKIVPQ
jgi:hypothetical protein